MMQRKKLAIFLTHEGRQITLHFMLNFGHNHNSLKEYIYVGLSVTPYVLLLVLSSMLSVVVSCCC